MRNAYILAHESVYYDIRATLSSSITINCPLSTVNCYICYYRNAKLEIKRSMLVFRQFLLCGVSAILALAYSVAATALESSPVSTKSNGLLPSSEIIEQKEENSEVLVTVVDRTDYQQSSFSVPNQTTPIPSNTQSELSSTEVIEPTTPEGENLTSEESSPNFLLISQSTEDLNPSPNPLLFPTEADEVRIENSQAITLKEAIELGEKNNQDLQLAKLTLERSREVLRQALGAKYPTLSTQVDFTRADSANTEISLARAALRNSNLLDNDTINSSFNANLQLNYNIYTGGSRSAQIRASETQIRVDLLDIERIAEQIRFEITTDYYNLQNANAQVGIEQAAVKEAKQSLRDAELLEKAGLGTKFDVLRAQVDLANAEQRLTLASSNEKSAQRQLVERLGAGQQVNIQAADPIEVAGDWNLSLEETIVLAYKNRAELEQFLLQREIDEEQQIVQLAAIRPTVSLFATYDVLEVLNDEVGPADGFTLGARLRWTLFDGGTAKARRNQEIVDVAIAETQFANQRNEIRLQVEQAYYELEANQKNIETAKIAVTLAEESLRLARLRFQAGVGIQTDVIEAQTELTNARGNLLSAIINYNQRLATLERAVSNLPDNQLFDKI